MFRQRFPRFQDVSKLMEYVVYPFIPILGSEGFYSLNLPSRTLIFRALTRFIFINGFWILRRIISTEITTIYLIEQIVLPVRINVMVDSRTGVRSKKNQMSRNGTVFD